MFFLKVNFLLIAPCKWFGKEKKYLPAMYYCIFYDTKPQALGSDKLQVEFCDEPFSTTLKNMLSKLYTSGKNQFTFVGRKAFNTWFRNPSEKKISVEDPESQYCPLYDCRQS